MPANEELDVPPAEPKAGGGAGTRKTKDGGSRFGFAGRLSSMLMVEVVAVAGGLVGTIVYTFGSKGGSWSTLSASVMIAAAALVSGGLIGILFGVPRSIAAGQQPAANPPAGPAGPTGPTGPVGAAIGANTNL
jgi:hypothetical protein